MSKSTKERVLNYVPINDTIGVPGAISEDGKQEQGEWIKSTDFTVEHLDRMVARAKNRKQDVHSFLVGNGLRHVDGTPTLFFEEEVEEEDTKKSKKQTP